MHAKVLIAGASVLTVGLAIVVAEPATAKTIQVTSTKCTGPGSLMKAIDDANGSSGPDTIAFAQGLVVDVSNCPAAGTSSSKYYFANVTGDVIFDGNGASLQGVQAWIDSSGGVNPLTDVCPADAPNIILSSTPGFLNVSPNVKVTLTDLNLDQLEAIAKVQAGASLTMTGVKATQIRPITKCQTPAITSDNATVVLKTNTWSRVQGWAPHLGPVPGDGAIEGGGTLAIDTSSFNDMANDGAIVWTSGRADIVSTSGTVVGGITTIDTTMNLVNSLWIPTSTTSNPQTWQRLANLTSQPWNVQASTILYGNVACTSSNCSGSPSIGWISNNAGQGAPGPINLRQSAVGAYLSSQYADPNPTWLSGTFTADDMTWLQDDLGINATALKALTGQPALRSGQPAFITIPDVSASFQQWATPLLGTPGQPGVLIDAVPNAACGQANQLLNPIDGTCITKDVFGNPRVDNNGKRNIGAVQNSFAPLLSVTAEKKTSIAVAWTRPLDPPSGAITGYGLFFRPVAANTWTRLNVSGAATLTRTVNGLTPDTAYEFYVVGVNGLGDGPDSNVVAARTLTDPQLAYPDGQGRVGDKIDPLVPHVSGLPGPWTFSIVKGDLPKGLSLNPDTGVISGTPQQKGTATVTVRVVSPSGSTQATLTIDIVAKNAPISPSLDYAKGAGQVARRFLPLLPQSHDIGSPVRFTLVQGALPPGLRLSARTGAITGTPTKKGTYRATVQASGSLGSAKAKVTITITKGSGSKKVQRPTTKNVVKVRASGAVIVPGVTNAGQQIAAFVTCRPAGSATAGEVRYCRVTGSRTGQLRVVPTSPVLVRVTVHFRAPATADYLRYHDVERFRLG